MKLIDADDLIQLLIINMEGSPLHRAEHIVNEMPTVEAIPIEWIENILTAMGDDSPYRPAVKWLLLTYKMEKEE